MQFISASESTEEQHLNGLSLPAQKKALTEYAENHGYTIVGFYADEGISARKPMKNRKGLMQLLEDVKEARSHGDLSENFEYKAAKKFKNENESRIRYLEKMIRTAKVISEDSAEDEVGMNNTVELYFEEDDEVETYKVVTTVRSNSLKNLIIHRWCST